MPYITQELAVCVRSRPIHQGWIGSAVLGVTQGPRCVLLFCSHPPTQHERMGWKLERAFSSFMKSGLNSHISPSLKIAVDFPSQTLRFLRAKRSVRESAIIWRTNACFIDARGITWLDVQVKTLQLPQFPTWIEIVLPLTFQSCCFSCHYNCYFYQITLPETNSLHLKMDGWNTIVSVWDGLFFRGFLTIQVPWILWGRS